MRRWTRAVTGAAVIACAGLAGGVAQAQESAEGGGLLRLAHLSPDTPAVDVYVDSVADPDTGLTLTGVDYGTVSDYQDVAPGEYTVSMREAGAGEDTPAVLSTTVEVASGSARTVAGVGSFADLGLAVLEDSLGTPPEGQARVRVLAGAATAETLDVALAGGAQIARGLPFASTGEYADVAAGPVELTVSAGGDPASVPVELEAGSVYSLVVLDGEGGLTVRPVLDAAGPGIVPQGGVETGAGGTASTAGSGAPVPALVGALLLVALVLVAVAGIGPRTTGRSRHSAPRG